jgi:methionyl-tRNA formyltransferase
MVDVEPLRIVFFGTPDFAEPTLEALLHSRHSVVGVVTRADRPSGRGQKTNPPPVKMRAVAAGVPVLQPERLADPMFLEALDRLDADLGVVAAYGKILTDEVLAAPRLGLLNVHASLLPRYRGAAPVHRAVINGETETGVTILRMVKALDAGPMLATARRPIGPQDTSEDVERDLAKTGAALLVSTVDLLATGPAAEIPQDDTAATYAHRISRADGSIDWTAPAGRIHDLIRGLYPWPHAFTFHHGRRLILLRSRVEKGSGGVFPEPAEKTPPDPFSVTPGTILEAHGDRLHIAAGSGVIAITEIQAEGKRPMAPREFLAGHRLVAGDLFADHA